MRVGVISRVWPVGGVGVVGVENGVVVAVTLPRELRLFAEDSTLPGGERVHARAYLRKMICRRLRALDAQIDAIDPGRANPAEQ
jgi:hypothetical protein